MKLFRHVLDHSSANCAVSGIHPFPTGESPKGSKIHMLGGLPCDTAPIPPSITMPSRPSIQARDSSGRQVSLLNDEPFGQKQHLPIRIQSQPSYHHSNMVRSSSRDSIPSDVSSPLTPGLTRADSFDSNNGPMSPLTPTFATEYGRQNSHSASYKDQSQYDYMPHEYPGPSVYGLSADLHYNQNRSPSYSELQMYKEDGRHDSSSSERGVKRYPCRFRDSHNCNKSFTTSGHASRHSKIHTAEKGVHCTFEGCPKKFTRADNMKQHLETHNKEKSRAGKSSSNTLTRPAGVRKSSTIDSRPSRPSSRNTTITELPPVDPALTQLGYQTHFLTQPYLANSTYGAPPVSSYQNSSPIASEHLGLDVLAAAVDFKTQA